jgi:hypothetical protein
MVPTAQRFSAYHIAQMPTACIYSFCTNAVTSDLLLAPTGGIQDVRKRAA